MKMAELERIKEGPDDGMYRWNPIPGKEYPLLYNQGTSLYSCRTTRGRYAGISDGEHIFFAGDGDAVLRYAASSDLVEWLGGEDEESQPFFRVRFDSEVPRGPEKDHILSTLRKKEERRDAA